MIQRVLRANSHRFLSRWVVLAYDVAAVAFSFLLAYLIRFNFNIEAIDFSQIKSLLYFVVSVYFLAFLITKPFAGIIRHTGLLDAIKILKATVLAFAVLLIRHFVLLKFAEAPYIQIPLSILTLHFLLITFILVGSRVFIKLLFCLASQSKKEKIGVIIYGAGETGLMVKRVLEKGNQYHYNIVAFVDDSNQMIRKSLEGVPIISKKWALNTSFIKYQHVQLLIIAIQKLKPVRKQQIVEKALGLHLKIKQVPSIDLWINGRLSAQQLSRIKIEELLERDTIELDSKNIAAQIKNKVVFVTGAAGSIGSEIARQIINYNPKRLILIDQAETPVYDLHYSFSQMDAFTHISDKVEFIVANVKDSLRMDRLMNTYRPDIIYHAAAYKHVPLMEGNPYEAVLINVFGTKTLADLAVKYKVGKFVMISTDKAVNPTNIMGATKRIAEIYLQNLNNENTSFVTTRFGNVLGSNGSVVPLFGKQIEKGGPVTITHKDITRYFMTIPEACNLVLEAGAMGVGGDVFVFNMGKPIKIYDLAKKMILLCGLELGTDIDIMETGLRPGEKLYEELLTSKENTLPTHHHKIMRAKVQPLSDDYARKLISELAELILEDDEFALVEKMKEIVPEFISNNSIYEVLDKKA